MPDLLNQYRVLYLLYEGLNKNKTISLSLLKTKEYLPFMVPLENFPELVYLEKNDYIAKENGNLELTGEGIRTTISLFRKFINFIKKYHPEDLSYWIKIFDFHKHDDWELYLMYIFISKHSLN